MKKNENVNMKFLKHLRDTFALDLRSLALFRFFLGFLIFIDAIMRFPHLDAFYSDGGVFPRVDALKMVHPWSYSLNFMSGETFFAVFLCLLYMVAGFFLMIGLKTKWSRLLSFILAVSFHNRNFLIESAGYDILRVVLFFSLFLPLNHTFSIDSALLKNKPQQKQWQYFSFWGVNLFFLIFYIYFFSYVFKNSPIWRVDFSAFYYASKLDIFITPLGHWLGTFENLSQGITLFSILLEYYGPLLLLLSFLLGRFWWQLRVVLILLFLAFHFGIFLAMDIGLFTFICEAFWLVFIPTPFWNSLRQKFSTSFALRIFYDGECGFCRKGVLILKEFLCLSSASIEQGQEDPSILDDMRSHHSWVVVNEKNERFFHYQAFLEILRHSFFAKISFFFFSSSMMTFLGNKVYHWVSHHRSLMGKATAYLKYENNKVASKGRTYLLEAFGVVILGCLFLYNIGTVPVFNLCFDFPNKIVRWLNIYHRWDMFSPYPQNFNSWFTLEGKLNNGQEIDILHLLSSGKNSFLMNEAKEREVFKKLARHDFWKKYFLTILNDKKLSSLYLKYLCRSWGEKTLFHHLDQDLETIHMISYRKRNLLYHEEDVTRVHFELIHDCEK